MNKEYEKVFTERGFTNIEQMATMFDYYKDEKDKYKNIVEEIQTELFDIKDMIYKPETREENISIQRKISEVIKKLEELKGE